MPVTETVRDSRSSIATDPLRNFRFIATFTNKNVGTSGQFNLATLGWMNISGLNIENSVISYREGGMNTTTQKMPGQSEFSPITMSRGVLVNKPHAYAWMQEIFSVIQGGGTFAPTAGNDFRCNLEIKVLAHPYTASDSAGNPTVPVKLRYMVYNCWPVSIGFSDLDAGGNGILMEQMVLQHEGWKVAFAPDQYSSGAPDITN